MRMLSKTFALAAAVLLAAAACSEPTRILASFQTVGDTLTVYALSGTPVEYPSALNTPYHEAVRADGSVSFDVAFDIDSTGRVLVYPEKLVTGGLGPQRAVGIIKATKPFDSLTVAPPSGYQYDSVTVAAPGDVLLIEAFTPYCANDILTNQRIYSKVQIDSVNAAARSIDLHMIVDPNCGFRQLVPGLIPTA